jgi:hypothetical protein
VSVTNIAANPSFLFLPGPFPVVVQVKIEIAEASTLFDNSGIAYPHSSINTFSARDSGSYALI